MTQIDQKTGFAGNPIRRHSKSEQKPAAIFLAIAFNRLVSAFFILTSAFLLLGCTQTQPAVNGIPNFGIVAAPANGRPGIYCGGEPTAAGNDWLQTLGVTRQVKLNLEPDAPGTSQQFEVIAVPITTGQQIFGYGLAADVPRAAAAIRPGTFIHCEHGKNRTQTVIGCWLLSLGVPKARALAQMKRYGWDDSLPGLKWYWSIQPTVGQASCLSPYSNSEEVRDRQDACPTL